jgi:hypothetical protein
MIKLAECVNEPLFFKAATFLIKRAIPAKLVQALRDRLVKNIKYIAENPMARDVIEKQKDMNRTLAALTRSRAKEHGYRLVQKGKTPVELESGDIVYKAKPGQEVTSEGFEQLFASPGRYERLTPEQIAAGVKPKLISGSLPSAVGFKVKVDPGGPEGIPYHMANLQGYGPTRGRPLKLHEDMRNEVLKAHMRAAVPARVTAIPGGTMFSPGSFNVSATKGRDWGRGAGIRDIDIAPKPGADLSERMNALPMWAGIEGTAGYTHFFPKIYSTSGRPELITPEIRKQMRENTINPGLMLAYDYTPGQVPLSVPKVPRGSAAASRSRKLKKVAPEEAAPAATAAPAPAATAAPAPAAAAAVAPEPPRAAPEAARAPAPAPELDAAVAQRLLRQRGIEVPPEVVSAVESGAPVTADVIRRVTSTASPVAAALGGENAIMRFVRENPGLAASLLGIPAAGLGGYGLYALTHGDEEAA